MMILNYFICTLYLQTFSFTFKYSSDIYNINIEYTLDIHNLWSYIYKTRAKNNINLTLLHSASDSVFKL